jgi:hypothetical protein
METYQILSRRNAERKVSFAPDRDAPTSPYAQLRRLSSLLTDHYLGPDDITDCDTAVTYWREFLYRKIFTGTSHEQFLETDANDPEAIDWLIAVAAVDTEHYQAKRKENRSAQ